MKRCSFLLACGLFAAALSGLAACDSALVGAVCKTGFTLCEGVCVDLRADFRNCGACGKSCGRFACEDGICSTTKLHDADGGAAGVGPDGSGFGDGGTGDGGGDGGTGDGGAADGGGEGGSGEGGSGEGGSGEGGSGEGGSGEGGTGDGGFDPDTGLGGCGLGEQECSGTCSNPAVDLAHCGSCDVACKDNEVCSAGVCSVQCEPPLMLCDGQCFDFGIDPDHCGSCGNRCASGICEEGVCADAIAGQVIVVGHDFLTANTAMRRLAGNAIFLARGAPVRVLVYRGEANDASANGVENALNVVKGELGRDWRKIDAIEAIVPVQLAAADAFLIHAQANATNSTLMKLGEEWGPAVAQFLIAGGVVVLFETPSATNDGTFRILEPAHIF